MLLLVLCYDFILFAEALKKADCTPANRARQASRRSTQLAPVMNPMPPPPQLRRSNAPTLLPRGSAPAAPPPLTRTTAAPSRAKQQPRRFVDIREAWFPWPKIWFDSALLSLYTSVLLELDGEENAKSIQDVFESISSDVLRQLITIRTGSVPFITPVNECKRHIYVISDLMDAMYPLSHADVAYVWHKFFGSFTRAKKIN